MNLLRKLLDKSLMKFLLVGVVNTLVGAGIMFLLYNVFHCSYWVSSIANYVVGGICSFFLNKFFTFGNREKSVRQVVLFVCTLIFCYLVSYVGARRLMAHLLAGADVALRDNVSMAVGMVLYTLLNYILQKLIVFRSQK
ncbi:MAG TPA: GtrA family protein [Treponema sp.]|nr:GtrA family protein [Treponema sp.]HBB42437.1 GtrA family protein [Treponema sp.]